MNKTTQYDIDSAKLLMDAAQDARDNAVSDASYYEAHKLFVRYRKKYKEKLARFKRRRK